MMLLLDRAVRSFAGRLQPPPGRYSVAISEELDDPAWDEFLLSVPGGLHVQGSRWGRLKVFNGWKVVRLIVREGPQIIAGAQILLKALRPLGYMGFVPKGPVITGNDPALHRCVLVELHRLTGRYHIRQLLMEPPAGFPVCEEALEREGLRLSPIRVEPAATLRVDLAPEPDAILAGMKSKCRYNIRLSARKGVTVRQGEEGDLGEFYRSLQATGERQHFSPPSEEYFREMWRLLAPVGQLKLFVAEVEGEAVSSLLAIPFGDTVTYKRGAWNGRHGGAHPNEAIQWAAMEWARSNGYRYYDFDGIDRVMAEMLIRGEEPPEGHHPLTSYKLGYGGEIILFPPAYDCIPNTVLRWGYHHLFPLLATSPVVQHLLESLQLH